MEHNRVFRINDQDIEELRDRVGDPALIDAYANWVVKAEQLDSLIRKINDAFTGLSLGDGTGLLEAKGLDDYATTEELVALRSRDEQSDWRRIDVETLNRCYAAPTFMNPRGFIFHLPAFLIAELNDNFDYGFIDRMIDPDSLPSAWIDLLNPAQSTVIADVLRLIADHPDYCDRSADIQQTMKHLEEKAG